MSKYENEGLKLLEPETEPTENVLKEALGDSYNAYMAFLKGLSDLEIIQEWKYFPNYKAWGASGFYRWTTLRGAKKEKTVYLLSAWDKFFRVEIWILEKNRAEVLKENLSDKTKKMLIDATMRGKWVVLELHFDITTTEPLADIYTLINFKKKFEM